MSKTRKKFPLIFAVFAHFLFALGVSAQVVEVKIKIADPRQSLASVEINFPNGADEKELAFQQTYADAENLDLRIRNLQFRNKEDEEVKFAQSSGGEFRPASNFSAVSYDLRLAVPENVLTAAHISWLAETHGVLTLNDALPDFGGRAAKISFELPKNWKISSSEKLLHEKTFQVSDIQKAVFLVGTDWRESSVLIDNTALTFSAVGDWNFSTGEAAKISSEILTEYRNIFGSIPGKNINVWLLRPPGEIGFDRWRAETRGANVTILSAPPPFESQAAQRLHEQLRHELFHLWIPNNLNLSGDYAWFYEGFTQYAALRAGLKLNRITFPNFLNTLEQAINLSGGQKRSISLIEASNSRWRVANSGIYAEGMLIAFLCDAALMRQNKSGGELFNLFKREKKSFDLFDIFGQIYQKHRPPHKRVDGNAAILEILQSYDALIPLVENYLEGTNQINLAKYLESTGIEIVPAGKGQKLQIKAKPATREKDLLNKLSYNSWRKF